MLCLCWLLLWAFSHEQVHSWVCKHKNPMGRMRVWKVTCRHVFLQTCRLLRHVSGTEPLEIMCIHAEETFQVTGQQVWKWHIILSVLCVIGLCSRL